MLLAAMVLVPAACSRYTASTGATTAPSGAPHTVPSPSGTRSPASRATPAQATPTPTPSPTPSPAQVATAAPTATPTPLETSVPVATTAPKHVVVPRVQPDAAPKILAVSISETTVHSGDTVTGSVSTTSNVASVEVRIATFGMGMAKTGVGRFALTYPIGNLPFFVRGTFPMRIIARNTRGVSTETTIPITVR
jgi:hypothetical protein